MNKKLLLVGAVMAAGFLTLTAFAGKTREQQQAEITAAVTAKLEEVRLMKEDECTSRVTAEAQTRHTQWVAEQEAAAAAMSGKKTTGKGKKPAGGVTPLPQSQPPKPTNPKDDKMQGQTNQPDKQDKMQGQPNTSDKKKKMGGGGN